MTIARIIRSGAIFCVAAALISAALPGVDRVLGDVAGATEEGTLSEAYRRMDDSHRRLALADTGANTREQQAKIIEILGQLIKEAEAMQSKSRGSSQDQKQGKSAESHSGSRGEGAPAGNTAGGSKQIDSENLNRLQRGGPQSPWSKLRDKDRDPVYSAIK